MKCDRTEEFNRDLKALMKKYRTLEDDIKSFVNIALIPYFELEFDTKSFVKIEGFCNETYDSYKVRKFAYKALKNTGSRSGIRIIFLYNKIKKGITFIEIYYKGEKENEDKERLRKYIENQDI